MGGKASSHQGVGDGDLTSANLILWMGASIQDKLRPSQDQIHQAWHCFDTKRAGLLPRHTVLSVLRELLDLQLAAAQVAGSKAKSDAAKQQAKIEREYQNQKESLRHRGSPANIDEEAVDRYTALVMGCAAGPVTAGMMTGYVDIPITCLTALRKDEELLQQRVDLLFIRSGRAKTQGQELLSLEDFSNGYLAFFDKAPALMGDSADSSKLGDTNTAPSCTLQ
eukprot:TRINITY_DN3938_c0_g4_i1.p1 TRINITY_DN3938_c0_g4~~TRINITY_DN3938_c0_g4_i1.p1  ORF type:complete len:223 (-),score=51.01 TRINITY_DN3938_c0_g4_i1:61-729(-)